MSTQIGTTVKNFAGTPIAQLPMAPYIQSRIDTALATGTLLVTSTRTAVHSTINDLRFILAAERYIAEMSIA